MRSPCRASPSECHPPCDSREAFTSVALAWTPERNARVSRCCLLSFELEFSTSSSIPIETAASHRTRRHPSCLASTSSHRDRSFHHDLSWPRRRDDGIVTPVSHAETARRARLRCTKPPCSPSWVGVPLLSIGRLSIVRVSSGPLACGPSPGEPLACGPSPSGPKRWLQSARFQAVARHSTDGAPSAAANALRV